MILHFVPSTSSWIGSADMMHRNLDRRVEVMAFKSKTRGRPRSWTNCSNPHWTRATGARDRVAAAAAHSVRDHRGIAFDGTAPQPRTLRGDAPAAAPTVHDREQPGRRPAGVGAVDPEPSARRRRAGRIAYAAGAVPGDPAVPIRRWPVIASSFTALRYDEINAAQGAVDPRDRTGGGAEILRRPVTACQPG